MKVVFPSYIIIGKESMDTNRMLHNIESAGRLCYQSEGSSEESYKEIPIPVYGIKTKSKSGRVFCRR